MFLQGAVLFFQLSAPPGFTDFHAAEFALSTVNRLFTNPPFPNDIRSFLSSGILFQRPDDLHFRKPLLPEHYSIFRIISWTYSVCLHGSILPFQRLFFHFFNRPIKIIHTFHMKEAGYVSLQKYSDIHIVGFRSSFKLNDFSFFQRWVNVVIMFTLGYWHSLLVAFAIRPANGFRT
jgi:hypothetical protein